ncbi:MATE family efflux transporter [Methylobacterium aerolatum]|uniref:MATE family efflux protein n=1 Tax=Methylobacterium aerolatum TaxID=418708 RepID=A0ABU0I5Q9_9HYPH|nr:MATE family efflux transporter [Methylobacterium aerolatum]MDQ0449215.1 putative MATE family efflux protein [Methylobacterium aerolatum]GJD35402.1 Multidrug export protein MepA [Methylobacterium aerolatum]
MMPRTSRPVDLGEDGVAGLILRLSGPAILGISAHALQMLVNAWFVADLGATAIATIAIAYPVTLLVAALGYGAGVAAASQVSRALGAGNPARAGAAAALGFRLALPAGGVVTAAILFDTPAWLRLLGADADLAAAAAPYTALATIGTALMLVMIVGGFVVRAQGHARLSGAIMVAGFGLNIVLDWVLIRLCGLGTAGAGWAAIGAQVAGAGAYLWHFAKARGPARLRLRPAGRREPGLVGEALRLAVPVTGSSLLAAFAMALFVEAAAPYGAAAVAAQGIALRLTLVAALPLLGLVAGAQAVIGHAAGSGRRDRLSAALVFTVAASLAYGMAVGGLMIAFAAPLAGLFAQDPETAWEGARALAVFALAFLPVGLQLAAATLFQAIGAPRRAAAVSLAAQGLALIPPLLLLPPLLGLEGVLLSRVVAEFLADGLGLGLMLAWAADARRTAGAAPVQGREAVEVPPAHEAAHQSA